MATGTTRSTAEVTLSPDALIHLGAAAGVAAWPAILDLAHPDVAQTGTDCADTVLGEVRAIGLLDEHAHPSLWAESALSVLGAPDAQIDICIDDDTAVHRACLARRGFDHVFAVRSDERIELSSPRILDVEDLGAVIGSVFGAAEVPEFVGISVPTNELRERLERCGCADEYAASFCAVGASRADAETMSQAFETCHVRAEVVATSVVNGVPVRSAASVNVYDTDRGRIIAAPSIASDGRMWTTIAPGTGDRMGHAVTRLIETLPGTGWMP